MYTSITGVSVDPWGLAVEMLDGGVSGYLWHVALGKKKKMFLSDSYSIFSNVGRIDKLIYMSPHFKMHTQGMQTHRRTALVCADKNQYTACGHRSW